jgi:hypothetical protein
MKQIFSALIASTLLFTFSPNAISSECVDSTKKILDRAQIKLTDILLLESLADENAVEKWGQQWAPKVLPKLAFREQLFDNSGDITVEKVAEGKYQMYIPVRYAGPVTEDTIKQIWLGLIVVREKDPNLDSLSMMWTADFSDADYQCVIELHSTKNIDDVDEYTLERSFGVKLRGDGKASLQGDQNSFLIY